MSALTFSLRSSPASKLDCSPLIPERLTGMSRTQIENLDLVCGGERLRAADVFRLSGEDTRQIVIAADGNLTGVGSGMSSGSITVDGDGGDYAGTEMRGGRLAIRGDAGAFAGSAMRGGRLEIGGGASAFLGAARPGERHGMRGGLITVAGSAGDRVGDRMRRGLILITGDAGRYCGARMIAGTVMIGGATGDSPGFGLRRGTLLLEREPPSVPATFQDSGVLDYLWITLLEKELARDPSLRAYLPLNTRRRRYCGDLASGGAGEILIAR
jgi:formylmethanofuran dehydrogenase subunit C